MRADEQPGFWKIQRVDQMPSVSLIQRGSSIQWQGSTTMTNSWLMILSEYDLHRGQ
jgi:hypothetical protein